MNVIRGRNRIDAPPPLFLCPWCRSAKTRIVDGMPTMQRNRVVTDYTVACKDCGGTGTAIKRDRRETAA